MGFLLALCFFVNAVSIDGQEAKDVGILTGKVDRINELNGLRYAQLNYYSFALRMEKVFCFV